MKITKKALGGSRFYYGLGWVSNGHYLVPLSRVENAALFSGSPEAVAAALGLKDSGDVREFPDSRMVDAILARVSTAEPWVVSSLIVAAETGYRGKVSVVERVLVFSASGAVAAFDRSYCDLLGIEPGMTIWTVENGAAFLGASPMSQERPELDEIAAILMPIRYGMATFADDLGKTPAAAALAFLSPVDDDTTERVLSVLGMGEPAAEPAPEMTPDAALDSLGINAGALRTFIAAEQLRAAG